MYNIKLAKANLLVLLLAFNLILGCSKSSRVGEVPKSQVQSNFIFQSKNGFEQPPQFPPSNFFNQAELKRENIVVRDPVYNDGWMNHFQFISEYGVFDAASKDMANIRISEIKAINILYQKSQIGVFFDSAASAGQNILYSPIKAAGSFVNAVANPSEIWGKIEKLPEGASKIWSTISNGVSDVASSSAPSDKTNQISGGDSNLSEEDVSKAAKFGLKQFGFNPSKNERELYQKLKIDPYNDNPVLKERVSRFASIQSTTEFSSRFIPGIGSLGFISDANKYIKFIDRISLYEDPWEIAKKNMHELREMGIPEPIILKFYSNKFLTPTYQTIIVSALKQLSLVKDKADFIELATTSTRLEDSLFFSKVAVYFVDLYQRNGGLKEIVVDMRLPAAVTLNNRLIIALPVDYLTWSEELAHIVKAFKQKFLARRGLQLVEIRVEGKISETTKQEFYKSNLFIGKW